MTSAQDQAPASELLKIADLHVELSARGRLVHAVNGVDLTIARGQSVGLVGESGSGKTVTSYSLMGILPKDVARITRGSIKFDGVELVGAGQERYGEYRGRRIALIMQDPQAALNPVLTLGRQLTEPLRHHLGMGRKEARARVIEVLRLLRIPDPERCLRQYPHQFSGGTRQRMCAAMAMCMRPDLVIADEPTTGLDVTIQADFIRAMQDMRGETGCAILWISHDISVIAQSCDWVNVMYAGRVVESGPVRRVLRHPSHPYTAALLASAPSLHSEGGRLVEIGGRPPDLSRPLEGCLYAPRCSSAVERCRSEYPLSSQVTGGGSVSCWRPEGSGQRG